jgi:hypothetical protein
VAGEVYKVVVNLEMVSSGAANPNASVISSADLTAVRSFTFTSASLTPLNQFQAVYNTEAWQVLNTKLSCSSVVLLRFALRRKSYRQCNVQQTTN